MGITLYKNADWILTVNEKREKFRHGDLLISGKEILDVGNDLEKKYVGKLQIDKTIDAKGTVILPGFVNVHHHTWQSLIRNIQATRGLKLEPWLTVMYEIYKDLNTDVARAGVYSGLGDMLKTGCTTSNDLWYPHPVGVKYLVDAEIQAAAEIGIRFHPTRGFHSVPSDIVPPEVVDTKESVTEDTIRLVKKYHDRSRFSMCQVGIAPSIAQYETEDIIEAVVDLAEEYDIMVHGHLAESQHEVEYTLKTWGCRPFEWFKRHRLLGKRFYFAHCIHLNEEEIEQMAETETGVAHCPISNMLEEIRCAYLLNRLTWGDQAATPDDYLYMATAGGAKVLGRDDIGYLAPGMAADFTVMDWNQLTYAGGCYDPVACIVESGDPRLVKDVVVNGELVVSSGKLTKVNEEEKRDYVNQVGRDLLTRASARIDSLKEDIN